MVTTVERRRTELHAVVLLLVGATVARLAMTGGYLRYVKPGLRPYLFAAAATLLAVGVLSLISRVRSHHDHTHGRFDAAWLLVPPMLALLVLAPPALGSYSAARTGSALGTAVTSGTGDPIPPGDPVRLSLLDYAARAVRDSASLRGRHVLLSGFLLPVPGGGWDLTRLVITCCAADAQPIKVGLTGAVPPGAATDAWYQVTGVYSAQTATDPVNAAPVPFVQVEVAHPIPPPREQYES